MNVFDVVRPLSTFNMAQVLVEYFGQLTGKKFQARPSDSIPMSSETPNNDDGMFRILVPVTIGYKLHTLGVPVSVRSFSVLYFGDLGGRTPWSVADEIDRLMWAIIYEDDIKHNDTPLRCTECRTISGAEAGYSFDELEKNTFVGGFTLTIEY